ncbi:MAG TPA: DNA cytosine methyltransferase [Gemmatimonadaceae bacterium]|jgi:DNA (cytosine-5)-methyltransferase 1
MTQKTRLFKLGELFSGPGGIGCAAHRSEIVTSEGTRFAIKHVWSNDYDQSSCDTFKKNIEIDPKQVFCEPVDQFVKRFADIPKIDCLSFGFPCNDFSNIGEKKGLKGTFGPLYEYGAHTIDHFKPKWFLAENVGGLTNSNEGKTFEKIVNRLRSAGDGYVLTVHLYKFEEYGVPQRRHRIVIVGMRKDLGLTFRVPKPTHTVKNWVTAREALEALPDVHSLPNSEITRQMGDVVERLTHIRPGENAWNANLPKRLQLNVKGARLSNIYRRLDPDKPAYTVTGSGGGGTHIYHYDEPRALTNRERARLQSFPDDYVFVGSKEQVRKQIGMAVPPLGARHILTAILKTFAGIPYPSVSPKWEEAIGEVE